MDGIATVPSNGGILRQILLAYESRKSQIYPYHKIGLAIDFCLFATVSQSVA